MGTTYSLTPDGRSAQWTCKYMFRGAFDSTQAAEWATDAALKDVPNATVEILDVKRTSDRRHTVTVRRTFTPNA